MLAIPTVPLPFNYSKSCPAGLLLDFKGRGSAGNPGQAGTQAIPAHFGLRLFLLHFKRRGRTRGKQGLGQGNLWGSCYISKGEALQWDWCKGRLLQSLLTLFPHYASTDPSGDGAGGTGFQASSLPALAPTLAVSL